MTQTVRPPKQVVAHPPLLQPHRRVSHHRLNPQNNQHRDGEEQ